MNGLQQNTEHTIQHTEKLLRETIRNQILTNIVNDATRTNMKNI